MPSLKRQSTFTMCRVYHKLTFTESSDMEILKYEKGKEKRRIKEN